MNGMGGDGWLPATGFGPGSILVAGLGGLLTFCGWVMRRAGRRKVA